MKFLLYSAISLLLYLVAAEAESEQPVKRRPRIRVYDQATQVMPVVKPVENTQQAEMDLDRKIRGDMEAPSGLQNPVNSVSFLPSLGSSSWNTQTSDEEDEEESWVTPMDFLLEEERPEEDDLLSTDTEDTTTEGEMEITDWDNLQKTMIEDALKTEGLDLTEEEMEEMVGGEEDQDDETISQTTGLEMEKIAPIEDFQSSQIGNQGLRNDSLSSGRFVPILRDEHQVAGEINRPQIDRRFELSGSQGLLNTLKDKWAKPSDRTVKVSSSQFNTRALPTESLMNRPIAEPRALSSFSAGNPAIRSLPNPSPVQVDTQIRRRQQPEVQTSIQPSSFPKNDYKIRSQLGVPQGM